MMATVMSFLRSYAFELLTLLGVVILAARQPKRKYGWLFLSLGIAANVGLILYWTTCVNPYASGLLNGIVRYFGQFILTLGIVYAWLDCELLTAMFVATTDYCMQQLSNRLNGALHECFLPGQQGTPADALLFLACVGIVYASTLHFFARRRRESGDLIQIANPVQLVIMTLALTVMIFIEQLSYPMIQSVTDPGIRIANYLSSAVFALLILILEFNVLKKRDLERELAITRRILDEERKQYEREKGVVEVINIKCHDLKHQLQTIGKSIPDSERAQIQRAVDQYDSSVRTGNHALDVVLTMKRMICEDGDIELSCMLDGKQLDFMEEADLFSLFGNMLDNAIEEVKGFDDAHRVIGLSVRREKQFVLIHEENYVRKQLELVDGIPQTTKGDATVHGFGIRSMQMVAEKYSGHLMIRIEEGVFQLDIMLPIPKDRGAVQTS